MDKTTLIPAEGPHTHTRQPMACCGDAATGSASSPAADVEKTPVEKPATVPAEGGCCCGRR
ncbi:hypothetical protein ACSSV1_006208 [Labrenzia sp. MBR-25]|jgi:hypothetical protein